MEQAERIMDAFIKNDSTIGKISIEETRDVVQMVMHYLNDESSSDNLKKKCFQVLCNVIIYGHISTKEKWVIYWTITYATFVDTIYDEYNYKVLLSYKIIFCEVKEKMPENILAPALENNEDGPIVITTSQFLGEKHAPTRRVLDYAKTIKSLFNKKVIIINEAGMHFDVYDYMENAARFNYLDNLENVYSITYKGDEFMFYQSKHKMLDFQEIANIVYNIRQLAPSLVLNVGENSITSDLCTCFVKTATIPCGTNIPISMAENLIVCRDVRDDDWERIDKIEPWQNVISSVFNYIMPQENQMRHYSRSDFGISEDAWIITSAGNRMEKELTDEFLVAVDEMLNRIQNSVFLVIGSYSNKQKITSIMKNFDRVILAGSVEDGSQAVRLADVYIQPKRKGGGRAAFEALYYGVPVVLLGYGDAWDVCGTTFEVNDYNEMIDRVNTLYNEPDTYEEVKQKSYEKGQKLEDMSGMFKELFLDLEMNCQANKLEVNEDEFYSIIKSKDQIRNEELLNWQSNIEHELNAIKNIVHWNYKKLRTNEWNAVFNSTIRGVDWLENLSLSPGRCAVDYPGLYAMYRVLDETRPQRILEIGLGQSTKVIGAYAEKYNATHYIVEHDRDWINFFFNKHGKNEKTEIVCVDRIENCFKGRYINTNSPIYYYDSFREKLEGQKFDFIFVDGPQGSDEFSRVDITEILPEALADDFVIMIDDSERAGEKRTISTIMEILNKNNIRWQGTDFDGQKNTVVIVSKSYEFLCSV